MADLVNEGLLEVYNRYVEYEEEQANINIRVPRRIVRDAENPFEYYRDSDFRKRYRFTKQNTLYIIDLISNNLETVDNRGFPISAMFKVLIALRYFATGTFQQVCGDLLKVSQSSVCRIVKCVAIELASLRPAFIKFPLGQQMRRNALKFYTKFGFPGVVGCIDGTHIDITSRGGRMPEVYRNRHNDFSYNVQCVTGPQLEILDIVARWPGSAHDSRIFDNSRIQITMETRVPKGYLLLGDRGYPCRPYLLTPLANPTTVAENRFQAAHIRTRNSVERTFGVWKRKFHCLSSTMAYKSQTLLAIIVATAVLYNIGNRRNDNADDEREYDENPDTDSDDDDDGLPDTESGIAVRRAFIERHFKN